MRYVTKMKSKKSSRRDFVRQVLGAGASLPFASFALSQSKARNATPLIGPFGTISPEDDKFLNDMEQANVQYFWEQANPKTGLVKDDATFIPMMEELSEASPPQALV